MNMVERHFDYIIKTGNIVAGAHSPLLQIQINPDAPFIARQIGAFLEGFGGQQNEFSFRFADAAGRYRQSQLANMQAYMENVNGSGPQFGPIYPQIFYPPNSNIEIDVQNDLAAATKSQSIGFRGTTLHRPESIYSPTYPPKFDLLEFSYPVPFQIVRGAATVLLKDQILQIASDADFVVTHCDCQPDISQGIGSFNDLRMKMKDPLGKFYSNDFIPVEWFLGNEGVTSITENPPTLYPAIYMKANDVFLFDLQLNDTGAAATLFATALFKGYKVFRR